MTDGDLAKDLAAEVLAVLDLQKECFKARDTGVLARCREAEAGLRKRCKAVLGSGLRTPSLFDPVDR